MARRPSFETRLARIESARLAAPEEGRAILAEGLADREAHLVLRSATLAAETEMPGLLEPLADALVRWLDEPARRDPGCRAKFALADALCRLDATDEDLFRRGLAHRQPEATPEGLVDAAADLRGACAMGLVRLDPPDLIVLLAVLLADREPTARAAAAEAIGLSDLPAGLPLLRYKLALGPDEPTVLAEVLLALLLLDGPGSIDRAAAWLDDRDPALADAAAMALGRSRRPEALAVLVDAWGRRRESTFLVAIALLRRDEAIDFLLSLIGDGRPGDARDAIDALAPYRHDPALGRRVRDAAAGRTDVDLSPFG